MSTQRIELIPRIVLAVVFAVIAACGGVDVEQRLVDAEQALERGDTLGALDAARDVLRAESSNPNARLLRANASAALGDFAAAVSDFERALESGVTDTDSLTAYVYVLLEVGEAEEALGIARLAVADVDARRLMLAESDVLLALQRTDEAVSLLESIAAEDDPLLAVATEVRQLKIQLLGGATKNVSERLSLLRTTAPDDPELAELAGLISLRNGELEAASQFFNQAADWMQARGKLYREGRYRFSAALAAVHAGNTEVADAAIERLQQISSGMAQVDYLRALQAFAQGDAQRANELMRRAHNDQPDVLPYRRFLGITELAVGNIELAEPHLRAALRSNSEDDAVRNALAEVYLRRGDTASAVRELKETGTEGVTNSARLSQALIADGKLGEAIELLRAALARNPDDRTISLLLAWSLGQIGDSEGAETVLSRLVQDDAYDYSAVTMLGSAMLAQGDSEKVENLAATLLRDRPDDPRAYAAVAWMYFLDGRSEDALRLSQKAAERFTDIADMHRLTGRLATASGQFELADHAFATALNIDPADRLTLIEYARLRTLQARMIDARKLLLFAVELDDTDPRPMIALAGNALAQDDIPTALKWSDNAVDVARHNVGALVVRATALLKARQPNAARHDLRLAALQPEASVGVLLKHAELELRLGGARVAEEALELALRRFPDNAQVLAELAKVALIDGRFRDADQRAGMALNMSPGLASANLVKGNVALAEGDLRAAAESFAAAKAGGREEDALIGEFFVAVQRGDRNADIVLRDAETDFPSSVPILMLLAQVEQQSGDTESAIERYRKVIHLDEENAIAYNNLGWILHENDRSSEAAEYTRTAVELAPDQPNVLDTHGVVLLALGDNEGALKTLRYAHERSDNDMEIRYHLAQAHQANGEIGTAVAHLRVIAKSDDRGVVDKARLLLDELE